MFKLIFLPLRIATTKSAY